MRLPNGIEIYIDRIKLTDEQFSYLQDNYDVEFYTEKNEFTLWVHDDGYKPFQKELFQYLYVAKGVYNNRTNTDHLDLYIISDEIDEYGVEYDGIKYKNIRMGELATIDLSKVILKRDL